MKISPKSIVCMALALLMLPIFPSYAAKDPDCTCDLIWPMKGKNTYITSYYGGRIHPITGKAQDHSGIDISAPKGTPIHAAEEGVLHIGNNSCTHNYGKNAEQLKKCGCGNGYGNYVYIVHPDGMNTLYAHMTSIDVADGTYVQQDQQIGTVGSTGRSTGFHLHFEVKMSTKSSSRADPLDYVSVPSFIELDEGNYTPGNLTRGDGYYLSGRISSAYSITSVTVEVLKADGTPTSQKKTYAPYSYSCDISDIDSYIRFGRLEVGAYILKISAADGSGAHSELLRQPFNVVSPLDDGILGSLDKCDTYADGRFEDVCSADWYSLNAALVYELGLMNGVDETHFDPSGSVTFAQAVTLAARIHSSYYDKTVRSAKSGEEWYQPYVDYASQNKLMPFDINDYSQLVSREQFVMLLAQVVSDVDLQPINILGDNAIPDVKSTDACAEAVYRFYRAGVLTGSDIYGTFYPYSHISRAEAAAIITRIVSPSLRATVQID